jgi:membrane glycosyltransferase
VTDLPVPLRRLLFLAVVLLLVWAQLRLAWAVLAPGGWSLVELLGFLCLAATAPWTALSAANSLVGLLILLLARDPPAAVLPALRGADPDRPPSLATAIIVCVRNEDMAAVLPPLGGLLAGLPRDRFTLWILSDTQDPEAATAEEAAIQAFRAAQPDDATRIRYRRRPVNTGFKAGNVMDFLDHHAAGQDLMLCLDADSAMTPRAVRRLVACMEADPRLAIVQQLIVGRPAAAAFPRLFQFGMRAGMRAWATGQAWWQADEGPYWGHNAIIRIAPFRAHCRLGPLPDGSQILSHDQVEAVRLHAAGWKVCCLPEEEGSMEGNPPALPEFLVRDRRWAAGNMQYGALLRLPGMTWMGRWQLLQAILLFLGTPLWVGLLLLGVIQALTQGMAAVPAGALLALMLLIWAMLKAPKLCGYAEVLAKPRLAARYGGRRAFLRGAGAELAFTTLLDPIVTTNKAWFLVLLACGVRAGWAPQNRAERGIAWGDAARLLWGQTLFGAVLATLLLAAAPAALPWALPWIAGLLLAIPFCVVTASPRFSARLAGAGIAATPEEIDGV